MGSQKYNATRYNEPLRIPSNWKDQDRTLVIQLERILDDIYRKSKKAENISNEIIENLETRMPKPTNDGELDQVLRSDGNGGSVWADDVSQAEIIEAVEDWLDENVPTGQTVVVDASLEVSGAAADAKKAGDGIRRLDEIVAKNAKTVESDKSGVDLDVVDRYGNVLVRFKNGHIITKYFDSASPVAIDSTLSQSGTAADAKATGDAISGINDDIDGISEDIDGIGDTIEEINGSIEELSDDVDGLGDEMDTFNGKIAKAPKTVDSDESGVDLDICDSNGNVIVRLKNGHIQTKSFDSSNMLELDTTLAVSGKAADAKSVGDAISDINDDLDDIDDDISDLSDDIDDVNEKLAIYPKTANSNTSGIDLDVTDPQGNVLVRFKDGHIETKNFNSKTKDVMVKPTDAAASVDFDLCDVAGNVIARIENGYIKTKKFDSTDPYELPGYYQPYLDQKCARIRELMESCGGDAFIFVTDQHFDNNNGTANAHQSFKLVRYIAQKCRINKLFLGGDIANGCSEVHVEEYRQAINGRCYACTGNHEYMGQGATEKRMQYLLTSGLDDENGNPLRRYFYIDNPKYKIRYIVVNTYSANNGSAGNGLEAAQYTWLGDAMDVDSGWTIIIFTHTIYTVTSLTDPTLNIDSDKAAFLSYLDAYSGNGEIAGVFAGHTHLDALRTSTGGIPVVITGSDKYAGFNNQEPWMHNRVAGTTTEQCIDVCVVDLVSKKITAVRVGGVATGNDSDDEEFLAAGEREISY